MIFRRTMSGFPVVLAPTSDIRLSLMEESHAHELFRLVDSNRTYLREWLPWLDSQQGVADSMQFIRVMKDQFRNNESMTMGIWYRNSLCGVIGYHRIDWLNKSSMIGYWIGSDHQGKGIMTESCRTMINHGIDHLGLHRIEIKCATGNRKSCAIPERLGFVNEGIARQAEKLYDHYVDLVVYSMLAVVYQFAFSCVSTSLAKSSISHSFVVIPAAIAGVTRRVL